MKPDRVVLGLVLVALGMLFLLERAGVLDARTALEQWWPVALIALGVAQLVERPRGLTGPLVLMGAGIVLLLFTLGIMEGPVWRVIWPVLLVVAGVAVIIRTVREGRARQG